MANPSTKADSFLNPKGSHHLLEVITLGTIAEHSKASQSASQERGSCAQCKITGFARDQPANED
jgi:hypothetical protein